METNLLTKKIEMSPRVKALVEYGSVAVAAAVIAAVSALSIHARSEYRQAVASREQRIENLDDEIARLTDVLRDMQSESETIRSLLDDKNTMLIALDSNGLVVEWNPACERRMGWTKEEMLGQNLSQIMSPDDFRRHNDGFLRWIADERNRGAVGIERCTMIPKVTPPFSVIVRFKSIGDFRNGRFARAIAFADPSRRVVDLDGVSGKPPL